MASIRKTKAGYRADVARNGIRMSKNFPTKSAASAWAARQEYLILNDDIIKTTAPFGEILQRYAREVSQHKRGWRQELSRIDGICKDEMASVKLAELQASDFTDYRDRRALVVAAGTVRREMSIITAVLNVAKNEWGLLSANPSDGVKKPVEPPPRARRPTQDEIDRMGHVAGDDMRFAFARCHAAFLFSIETGMRAGEMAGLTWDCVDIHRQVAHLPRTKNGRARDVPLSREAIRILNALGRDVFDMTSPTLSAKWAKLRDKAGVSGLRLHDARHEAVTRLSLKLDVLALAKMIGHRDIKMLMTYYDEDAADLAKRLD